MKKKRSIGVWLVAGIEVLIALLLLGIFVIQLPTIELVRLGKDARSTIPFLFLGAGFFKFLGLILFFLRKGAWLFLYRLGALLLMVFLVWGGMEADEMNIFLMAMGAVLLQGFFVYVLRKSKTKVQGESA